jgi:hypothetical protein
MVMASREVEITVGDVEMVLENGLLVDGARVRLTNVLYVPGIRFNLLSGSRLTAKGIKLEFEGLKLTMKRRDGSILGLGDLRGRSWLIRIREVI